MQQDFDLTPRVDVVPYRFYGDKLIARPSFGHVHTTIDSTAVSRGRRASDDRRRQASQQVFAYLAKPPLPMCRMGAYFSDT